MKRTNKFCFIDLFCLNKTKSPTPLPAQSPATSEPKLKPPLINSSRRTTDAQQFGMSPIAAATSGWKIESDIKAFVMLSVPT